MFLTLDHICPNSAPLESSMGPSAGAGWGNHTLKLHHQGVPERARPLPRRSFGAAPPITKGYGCIEEREAARPIFVPEEGLGLGKFLDMPY